MFLAETSQLRKICKKAFLLWLPVTRLKSLENWLGTYFLLYLVLEKLKDFLTFSDCILQKCEKTKECIVRPKLYPVERKARCQGSDSSRCHVCRSVHIIDEFTSFATESAYKINHIFDCNNKCLIYLLNCKWCDKQYLGNTNDHIRSGWNSYKCHARKAESARVVT